MKRVVLFAVCFVCSSMIPVSFAADVPQSKLEEIIKEREANLQNRVRLIEKSLENSTADCQELYDAKIMLLEYRKKMAKTPEDQIRIQSEIVDLAQKASLNAMERYKAGLCGWEAFNIKDRELAAKQELAEMMCKNQR